MSDVLFPAVCFGKLPSHGDFIRHNAASREVLGFDEWIHQGLYFARTQCGSNWDQIFASSRRYHFLFYPENAERLLVGLMQPSHDKSMRRYPFFVSLLIDRRRSVDGQAFLLPVVLSEFFDRGNSFLQRALNGMDAREIADQTESLGVARLDHAGAATSYRDQFLQRVTMIDFWKALWSDPEDPRKYLIFKNLGETLQPFKSRGVHRLTLGLRFPLSGNNQAAAFEVCFWAQVCLTMLDASSLIPVLFWSTPREGSSQHLYIFFRQPSARTFLQLLRPDVASESICVVDEEGKEKLATLPGSFSTQYRSLVDSSGETPAQFLEKLQRTSDAGYYH